MPATHPDPAEVLLPETAVDSVELSEITPAAAIAPQHHHEITAEAISRHVRRPSRTKFSMKPVVIAAPAKQQNKHGNLWAAAFCLSTLCLLIIGIGARNPLVHRVPQLAGLFKTLHMPVNLRGLEFKDVKTRLIEENGQQVLAVEGTIANLVKTPTKVPNMRVSLRGDDGREIYSWTAQPTLAKLDAGGTVMFRTRLASPPSHAKIALVNFAEADEVALLTK